MLTLWDLIPRKPEKRPPTRPPTRRPRAKPPAPQRKTDPRPGTAAAKYEAMTRELLAHHGIRVRKWRSSMSGVAWQVTYTDGRVSRLIESPKPRGPVSASIFLHEIGHHAIGFNRYRPRCLEEYHAWAYAVAQMQARGIPLTDRVQQRICQSLRYAVAKARRRGLKRIPPELVELLQSGQVERCMGSSSPPAGDSPSPMPPCTRPSS